MSTFFIIHLSSDNARFSGKKFAMTITHGFFLLTIHHNRGAFSPRSWCFLTPRGVILTPRGVVLTPRGVDLTPRGVEKKILNLKPHPPGGSDLTPRGAVSTPRGVRHGPTSPPEWTAPRRGAPPGGSKTHPPGGSGPRPAAER